MATFTHDDLKEAQRLRALTNPLLVVNELFDAAKGDGVCWGEGEYFSSLLNNMTREEVLQNIPLLTKDTVSKGLVSPGSLVRYRGMLQDVFDPEYYIGAVGARHKESGKVGWLPTKYTDTFHVNKDFEVLGDESKFTTMARLPLFCVPVPGESVWVKDELDGAARATSSSPSTLGGGDSHSSPPSTRKRSMDSTSGYNDVAMESVNEVDRSDGRRSPVAPPATQAADEGTVSPAREEVSVFPLGDSAEDGIACLVKVYDCDGSLTSNFRVNTVMEFVGILSADPVSHDGGAFDDNDIDTGLREELRAHNPLPSLVPRLHCVSFRPVGVQYRPSLAPPPFYSLSTRSPDTEAKSKMTESSTTEKENWAKMMLEQRVAPSASPSMMVIRSAIVKTLSAAVGGDSFLAEHIFLHILSRVRVRNAMATVGTFSLNVFGFKQVPSGLMTVFKTFLVNVLHIPLSIEYLNGRRFAPKKDYEMNRLLTGPFQTVDGSLMVLDETAMDKGKLDDTGCKNLRACQRLASEQTIQYDFQYHEMEWKIDAPVLLLSDGQSIIKTNVRIPVNALFPVEGMQSRSMVAACLHECEQTPGLLQGLREYLSMARHAPFVIPKDVGSAVESSFVEARRLNPKVTAEDMHLWLCFARLYALSYGESALTMERWEQSFAMQAERELRYKQVREGMARVPPEQSP